MDLKLNVDAMRCPVPVPALQGVKKPLCPAQRFVLSCQTPACDLGLKYLFSLGNK